MWLLLILANLRQQAGLTTWDTKYDLTANPVGLLGRSLHLWNPDASLGELQNQAYGYLFPQGPFFVLGHLASVPDWVTQRLWSALLLIAAYEGTRAVARSLGASNGAAVVGGLVYALSPRLLGAVGVLSGEVLPTAVLPWVVLPLLAARAGRLSARQAGLWSGVALLFMSGVNAAGVLATFPLLMALVVDHVRRTRKPALALWWGVGVAGATVWWLVPLVLLGRYSPPFLDFIETASSTTASTGWANDVRGSEHWLAYFTIGDQPWWPGAHATATTPVLVVAGALVAAWGLFGLVHPRMPARGPLVTAAVVGLLCLTAAQSGALGSLVDGSMREVLDGALAPFRNVHKVDPLIRLPLALGAAHTFMLARDRVRDVELRRWVTATVVAVVLVTGAPLFVGQVRMPGFEKVPDAWGQAAQYLDDEPGSRALVIPGSGFGLQTWGWTIDEPLQGEARSAWVTRSQVPLVPGPTARYLDTIERRIASGEGSPELAAMLARGGITHVLLRRDLDPFRTETVPADRAQAALLHSPGLTKVAQFGQSGFGDLAMIDIYEVERPVSRVSLLDASRVPRVVGAPDDLLPALETGVLGDDPAMIVAGDDEADPPRVVGDGYTDVERQFGRVHDAVGDVRVPGEPTRQGRRQLDFPGVPGVPEVTAAPVGGATITASSSRGYADEYGAVQPEFAPSAAFDGNLGTEWQSGTLTRSAEQWLQVDLAEPIDGGVLSVRFVDVASGARVVRARVVLHATDGTVFDAVYGVPADGNLLVPVPRQPIDRVRTEVVEARGANPAYGHVAVSEISLPGVATGRTLDVPGALRSEDSLVLRTEPPRRACVDIGIGPGCTQAAVRAAPDGGRIDRTVHVEEAGSWQVTGSVVASASPAAAALMAPVTGPASVRASSVLADDPAVAGLYAFDGDPGTVWLAAPSDEDADLVITGAEGRTISALTVAGPGGRGIAPRVAVLRTRGEKRVVDLGYSNEFEPLRTGRRLEITFRRPAGSPATAPLGVGEVQIDGLEGLEQAPDLSAETGAVCGLGPQLLVDGVAHDTAVRGTIDDVRLGTPLTWTVCDGDVELTPGAHRVTVVPTLQFQPVALGWQPTGTGSGTSSTGSAESDRDFEVRSWSDAERSVDVGPGETAILRVAENLNDGWRATLDGDELERVALDGWQQGYVVPAGDGGRVTLEFVPDGPYRGGLLVGLVLACLLLLGAVAGQLLERRRRGTRRALAPVEPIPDRPVGRRGRRATAGVVAVGLLVLGGPVAAVGFVAVGWRRFSAIAVPVGVALVGGSGLLAAWAENTRFGRPPLPADMAAAAGVGLLVGAVVLGTAAPASWAVRRHRVGDGLASIAATLRANPVVVAGVVLVLAQAVVRFWLAEGSFYWQDDFVHLDLAHRLGLSEELIVRQHNEHVEFGPWILYWVISLAGGVTFAPAVAILVVLQAAAGALFWTLLCTLFGRSRWLLVPLAAYLFTPVSLVGATWLASGVEAFTLQPAMFLALIGLVRLRRTGRWRWAALCLVSFTVGVLCWQKAIVVLPVLLAVDVLVLGAGTSVRARLRALRERWWLWAAHLVVLGVYAAVYVSLTTAESFDGVVDRNVGQTLQDMLLKTFVPGMFGGPWTSEGAVNSVFPNTPIGLQVVGVVLLVVVLAASFLRSGRWALGGWLLAVGYVACDAALVFAGRGEFLGLVARDPRYFTDAVPVVLIAVCAAFSAPRRSSRRAPRYRPRRTAPASTRRRVVAVVLPVALTLGLVASGLTTTVLLAPSVQHEEARAYVQNLVDGVGADPGASIASAFAPDDIGLLRSVEMLLGSVGQRQVLNRPGTVPYGVDGTGHVVPETLSFVDLDDTGEGAECGWSLGAYPGALVELEPVDDQRVLQLTFVTGAAGVLHVEVDGVEQALSFAAGVSEGYFSVTGLAGPVEAWVSDSAAGVCVTSVRRGALVPQD